MGSSAFEHVIGLRAATHPRAAGIARVCQVADLGKSWDDPALVAAQDSFLDAAGRLTTRIRCAAGLGAVHLVGTLADLDAHTGAWSQWVTGHVDLHRPVGSVSADVWWAPQERLLWTLRADLADTVRHALSSWLCAERAVSSLAS